MIERRRAIALLGAAVLTGCTGGRVGGRVGIVPLDLEALEARTGGRLGFAALDLANDRLIGWRTAERFAYCSTFKLFLAAATLERVARGQERLDRPVAILPGAIVPYAPITGPAVGKSLTVDALCKAMVELSDNPAANILIEEMGGIGPWRDWYRSLGDGVTRVDRLEPELNSAIPGDPRDTTTPAQTVLNLASIWGGNRLLPEHRRQLETWLVASPTGPGRIRAGVPAGWRVGHKTGTSSTGPANDIGILWPPGGAPILISAYFHAASGADPAERDAVIADATRRALLHLGRH